MNKTMNSNPNRPVRDKKEKKTMRKNKQKFLAVVSTDQEVWEWELAIMCPHGFDPKTGELLKVKVTEEKWGAPKVSKGYVMDDMGWPVWLVEEHDGARVSDPYWTKQGDRNSNRNWAEEQDVLHGLDLWAAEEPEYMPLHIRARFNREFYLGLQDFLDEKDFQKSLEQLRAGWKARAKYKAHREERFEKMVRWIEAAGWDQLRAGIEKWKKIWNFNMQECNARKDWELTWLTKDQWSEIWEVIKIRFAELRAEREESK